MVAYLAHPPAGEAEDVSLRLKYMAEMPEVPKVSFLKAKKTEIEFEIFTLNSLFSRQHKLRHPLDKPHRIDFYHILFVTKGTGLHYIDFRPYEYSEGSTLFISKGQVQAFDIDSENDGYLILFTEAFLSKNLIHSDVLSFYRLYNYHLHLPVIHPNQTGIDVFNTIISEIYKEYNYPDNFAKEEILRLLLKLLLLKAERIKRTLIPQEKNAEWFIRFGGFQSLLEKHISQIRNANAYAEMMAVSYKHLNEICKSVAGRTAKEVIDSFLILEIKRHLAISNISVKELSYQLGFDEATNFVKFFKKHTGQSPVQFRKNLTK